MTVALVSMKAFTVGYTTDESSLFDQVQRFRITFTDILSF